MKSGQVTAEPQTMKYIIIGIVVTLGIIVVAIIVVIVLVCRWVKREDPDLKSDPPPEKVYIAPRGQDYQFSYMQLQDCRLKINSRDPITGNTPLFDAVLRKDYVKVRELVEEGVVLDAVCGGESLRTALFQLEFQKNKELCALLLKRGADQLLVDAAGENCEMWADDNGVGQLFKEYYELRQNHLYTKPRRIIPDETPRSWNVLVFDGCECKGFKHKKLPLRIKKRITWGYVEGMNLDEFTHIVVPSNKAVLMKRYWLQALVEWKDRAMDEDYRWYLLDTLYEGSSHCDAIYNIKTNYYRMVPCLLKNADICILPSTSKDFEKNRNEWKKIIETLGGTYVNVTDVKPDNPKTITPYWTGTQEYKDEHGLSQNRCWILKTEGCQINSEWRKDRGMYTLADFRFLTESIAKHSILSKDNLIEPLDYEGRPVVDLSWSAPEPPSKSLPTDRKTPVMSPMEAMKDAEMKKRQQEMKEEIKKASSKAAVNQ